MKVLRRKLLLESSRRDDSYEYQVCRGLRKDIEAGAVPIYLWLGIYELQTSVICLDDQVCVKVPNSHSRGCLYFLSDI